MSRLLLIAILALQSLAAQAQVTISVLAEDNQKKLIEKFPDLISEKLSLNLLDQVIQYLVVEEEFDYAEFMENANGYILNVGKNKRIAKIQISGNDNFSEALIRRELGLVEKSRFDQEALIDGAERLRALYDDNGFPNSVVDLEFFKISDAEMEIRVKIAEGPQLLITDLEVRTDNPQLKTDLTRHLKKYRKEAYTERQIAELRVGVREFFSARKYYKADLAGPTLKQNKEQTEVALSFGIEHPYKYNLIISGYRREGRGNIESALELDQFFSANPSIGPELANKIKQFYLRLGYARVAVTSEERPGKHPFTRDIELKIEEGPKIKINSLAFVGNLSLTSAQYKDRLESFSTELLQDGFYNREDLDVALKNLVIDRQNQGFLKAKINSTRTTYTRDKDEIDIVINFDEGPLTQLESVSFSGNNSFTPDQLRSVTGLKPGEPLKLIDTEESIEKLKSFYRNSGYLEMQVLNEKPNPISYNSDNTLAQVKYEIAEGPQVKVATIVIEGNSLTKDDVIRKELEFTEGDVLTPALQEESKSRMERLGHFNTIEIRTLEERTQIADRTIIVRVSERDPGLVNFGIGVNNERELTIRGFTGIAYRNLFGTGRSISARLDGKNSVRELNYFERQITLGYLEPYLFNTRIRGRINLSDATAVDDPVIRKANRTQQMNYLLEQDLTSNILFTYELLGLATVRTFPIDPDNPNNLVSEELNIGTTGPTLEIDLRDHPFTPTRGSFSRFNIEYGSPSLGSTDTIEYVRGFANYTHYLPVSKSGLIWANSARLGYLKNISDRPWVGRSCAASDTSCNTIGVPYNRKGLTLGGQTTLRGFTPSEAFPNVLDGIEKDYLLQTEAQSFLIKSELRFPIPYVSNLGGALFYDGGSVLIQGVDIEDPYRDCLGIALRYTTPVGAVSVDYGFKLDPRKGDASLDRGDESKSAFHFSIGTF